LGFELSGKRQDDGVNLVFGHKSMDLAEEKWTYFYGIVKKQKYYWTMDFLRLSTGIFYI
jgi:hypothetical protein